MADQDILVTLDNLEYYQEELIKKLPKEQVWYGDIEPSSELPDQYILAVNYQAGKIYYRLIDKKWKLITSGNQEDAGAITSKITISRISQKDLYISPDDKKCEISCKWVCTINGKQVTTNGTISVIVNTIERQTFKAAPGTIKVDVKEYLKEGSNKITIKIKDGYNSEKSIDFSVEVVKLIISTSGHKQNQHIYLDEVPESGVGINIITSGGVSKRLHMKIDGEEINLDVFPTIEAGNQTVTAYIPKQDGPGSYLVEIYITHTFETTGKTIYSNSVFFDTLWIDRSNSKAIIASSFRQAQGKQYDTIRIPYYLYNGARNCLTRFTTIYQVLNSETGELENEVISTPIQERQTEVELEWIVDTKHAGKNIYKIEVGRMVQKEEDGQIKEEFSLEDWKEFVIDLEQQSTPPISEANNQLYLSMVAPYTDNKDEANRTNWPVYTEDGVVITPKFNDKFDWSTNGWLLKDDRPALKISNGAQLHVPYKIFGQSGDLASFTKVGGTIEIDVSFDEISDSNLDFFTCYEEGSQIGIKISPSRALLSSSGSTAQVKYANSESKNYNNSMRFTFVINPVQPRYKPSLKGEKEEHDTLGSMYIYINGVGASASGYSATDIFKHSQDILFKSEGCSVYLHSLKIHRIALNPTEVLKNWICDMNAGDQINAYNRNWIYDLHNTVDYGAVLERLPCLTFIGRPDKHPEEGTRFPTFKGDKKIVDIVFEGTEDELYDFTIEGAQMDVQGTSSQYYPVKNWKFKVKENPFMTPMGPMEKYALAEDQLPAKVFCLKADYMETSSTHNTVTANLANSMYDSDKKTPPQKELPLKEGEDAEKEKDRAKKTRTTIYGRPIVVFYKEDADSIPVFGGKYNFNYDKDAEDVFGFFENDEFELVDCVEFRANDIKMCNFKEPFSVTPREGLSPAEIKEYDEHSIINATSAEAWGNAFEFRYHWHREEGTEHYSYLQAVSDWVYNKDCENPTNKKLDTPIEDRTFETGVAKFLYDNDSKIIMFKDTKGRNRKALNLGNIDQTDYLIQSYFETKEYEVTKLDDGTESLKEKKTTIAEKEAYISENGEEAWNELIKTEGQEEYPKEENNTKDFVRIIRTLYYSLWWDEEKGKEVYIFENDTKNYRLTLFKNELPEHFDEHYCLMYFLLMELLAMIDSGTKNMFWATWGERHQKHPTLELGEGERDYNVIWYPIFYDMDSILGLNNVGKMNIPYSADFESSFEDFPNTAETGKCFNGADNVFWNNFRQSYETELNLLFNEKVASGVFSLTKLLQMYESHSENFPASLYNEDGKLKIIDKYFQGYYEATPDELKNMNQAELDKVTKYPDWLYVYQGDRYYYRRFWLPNRFNYMLSKNFAGSYAKDFISMRLYDPNKTITDPSKKVHTDYDFTIETWKDQYTTIKYGSRSVSVKCQAEQPIKIEAPNDSYNDTETAIFGASNIKRIGDVSTKYATTIDLSAASSLIELDLGNSNPTYKNEGLTRANFGSNTMLRRVNLENCIGLSSDVNLAACPNIKEINAKGTQVKNITLGKNGILETLLLPSTIKSLVLVNQPNLQAHKLPGDKDAEGNIIEKEIGFLLPQKINATTGEEEGYDLTTLIVKNTPNVNTKELVEDLIYKDSFKVLDLEGISWTRENRFENGNVLLKIKQRGQDANDVFAGEDGPPKLYGDCEVYAIKDYLLDELNSYFNDGVPADKLRPFNERNFRLKSLTTPIKTHTAKFYNYNGEQLFSGIIDDRVNDDTDFSEEVTVIPTRKSEWDRDYEFVGWKVTIDKSDENYDEEIDGTWEEIRKKGPDGKIQLPKTLRNLRFDAIYDIHYKEFTFEFYCNTEEFKKREGYDQVKECLPIKLTTQKVELELIPEVWAPVPLDYNSSGNSGKDYPMYRYKFQGWDCLEGEELNIKPNEKIRFPDEWSDVNLPIKYTANFAGNQMYRIRFYDTSNGQRILLHARENLEDNGDEGGHGDIYYLNEEVEVPMPTGIWYDWECDYKLIGWKEVTEGISKGTELNYSENQGTFTPLFGTKYVNSQDNGLFTTNNYEIEFETAYEDTPIDYTIDFKYINGGPGEDTKTYGKNVTKILNWHNTISLPTQDDINALGIVGYSFNGWKRTEDSSDTVDPVNWMEHIQEWSSNKPGDRRIEYYVDYSPIIYNVYLHYLKTDNDNLEGIETIYEPILKIPYLSTPEDPLTKEQKDYQTKNKVYNFERWEPQLNRIENDTHYQAIYDAGTIRKYTIQFIHPDTKEILEEKQVSYGEIPAYTGTIIPTRAATAEWTYTFNKTKWIPSLAAVQGDQVYEVDFEATKNSYYVRWYDGNGEPLTSEPKKFEYDTIPVYNGSTPTKLASQEWTYTFNNKWIPDITVVKGEQRYVADFDSKRNQYEVIFKGLKYPNGEEKILLSTGKVDYGYSFEIPDPTEPGYIFNGWGVSEIEPVVRDNIVYQAQYTPIPYTLTFQNYRGEDLGKIENWTHDQGNPVFDDPTYPAEQETAFAFMGWIDITDKEIEEGEIFDEENERFYPKGTSLPMVTKNSTFKAHYSEGPRKCTVTFCYINTGLPKSDGSMSPEDPESPIYYGQRFSKELDWGKDIIRPTKEEEAEWGVKRDGYTFHGWRNKPTTSSSEWDDGSNIIKNNWINVSETYTFYAVWSINTYPVVFEYIVDNTNDYLYGQDDYLSKMWKRNYGDMYTFGDNLEVPTEDVFNENPLSQDCLIHFQKWERYLWHMGENEGEETLEYEGEGIEETVTKSVIYKAVYTTEPRSYMVRWYAGNQCLKEYPCNHGTEINVILNERPGEYRKGYYSSTSKVGNVLCAISEIYNENTELIKITGNTNFYAEMRELIDDPTPYNWGTPGVRGQNTFFYGGTVLDYGDNYFKFRTKETAITNDNQKHRAIILDSFKRNGIQKVTADYYMFCASRKATTGFGILETDTKFFGSYVKKDYSKNSKTHCIQTLDASLEEMKYPTEVYNNFAEAVMAGKYWIGAVTYSLFGSDTHDHEMTDVKFYITYHGDIKQNKTYSIFY